MLKAQTVIQGFFQCLREQWRCQIGTLIIVAIGIIAAVVGCNRGPVFYENDENTRLASGEVHIVCYGSQTLAAAADGMVEDSNVYTVATDGNGRFDTTTDIEGNQSSDWPDNCKYVLALNEKFVYEQGAKKPQHGPAYIVYGTNWTPGNETPQNIKDPIVLFNDEDHRLVLFNVVVSIAWEARAAYVKDLEAGLRKASGLLYDLTDGQMAFARPSIYINGSHWNDADMRVLAANDYRPTAYVGGMVRQMTPFWADGIGIKARHHPGAIFLGRYWDASDAANGLWSEQEGYSTIVHEWGHYALFLHDEYLNKDHEPASCGCPFASFEAVDADNCVNNKPEFSPMYYQYADDGGVAATEFWHTTNENSASCNETLQAFVHGQSDWNTLGQWYQTQRLTDTLPFPETGLKIPAANPQAGPAPDLRLIDDLARFFVIHEQPDEAMPDTDQTELNVTNADKTAVANQDFPAQVYVLEDVDGNGRAHRIIYQGLYTVNGQPDKPGKKQIVGVHAPPDQLRVFVDQYATNNASGSKWKYETSLDSTAIPLNVEIIPDDWQASLDITYTVSGISLTAMTVTVTSTNPIVNANTPFTAQLCAMDTEGCREDWVQPMTNVNNQPELWQATIAVEKGSELPRYGIVRIHAEGVGEIIRWIQVAGVGPIHGDSDSPTRDGTIIVDTLENIPLEAEDAVHECYRVIVMPAAKYELLQSGILGKNNSRIVGVPLEVDMVMTDTSQKAECRHFGPNEELLVPVVYTLFFDAGQVTTGASLRVLQYISGDIPDAPDHWVDVSSTDVAGLSLKYNDLGGNLNLHINGEFKNFDSFAAIDGATIGGVKIANVNFGNGLGALTLTGPINTYAIGGQEIYIDDVCLDLASDGKNQPCIDFEDQYPGAQFSVDDIVPTDPFITVDSFSTGNAEQANDGFAQIVQANDEGCNCVSGQMLAANQVSLNFDLSLYRSEQTDPWPELNGEEPEIAWISTAPILHSGIFVLVEKQ